MFNWGKSKNSSSSSPSSSSSSQIIGINLPDDNKVAKIELREIAEKYEKRSRTIDAHLRKSEKDKQLANKLAASFIHNYHVMIDISVLLNQYAEFFQTIKESLLKSDVQLEQLNAQNFQNLEKLTRQEVDKFTVKFSEQAQKVQKLFQSYNMNEEARKLGMIPGLTSEVTNAAEESLRSAIRGGGKKYLRKELDIIVNGRKGNKKKAGKKAEGR
jgi:hypothetical protein